MTDLHRTTLIINASPVSTVLVVWMAFTSIWLMETKQLNCDFNELCICQPYTGQYLDVTCINVPVASVPRFTHFQHLYRIRLVGVPELTQLHSDSFDGLITLASLTISKSGLFSVNASTFATTSVRHTLSTVDLSYGQLIEIPAMALSHLHQLQWLSLKGNQIELIKAKDFVGLNSVRTLLLNENAVSIVEDRTFSALSSLELIDFDGNMIERVEGNPFPSTLKSLSMSNCLLRKIPFNALHNLANLEVLQLRGNLISHLSPFKLASRRIELIDLSHNLISNLPNDLFASLNQSVPRFASFRPTSHFITAPTSSDSSNETDLFSDWIEIRKFQLDFNFIHSIPPELFRAVLIEKLTLSSNRISSALISRNAFQGPLEQRLKVLDLNYNLIDKYPVALKALRALKQLLLKNNRIKEIESDAFVKCSHTLETLDLSQNLLEQIPRQAFSALRTVVKVNLHDNLITGVSGDDLDQWCHSVKSLILSKNNLRVIQPNTFRQCTQLTELRLGGNNLLQITDQTIGPHLSALRLFDLSCLANVAKWMDNNNDTAVNGLRSLHSLRQVKWLQFDMNSLSRVPPVLTKLFPSLMYVDLQNNRIDQLHSELTQLVNLTTVILSHNNLTNISVGSFHNLSKLESIAMYFNRITTVASGAFEELPKLHSLVLSKNQISHIEPDAFYKMSSQSNSLTLMLDGNKLRCLSANSFQQIGSINSSARGDFSFYLNVSNNQIETFVNCFDSSRSQTITNDTATNQSRQTLAIRVLDLSSNRITELTNQFFRTFCLKALSLFANNNLLRSLPVASLRLCPHLQTLSLNYNQISVCARQLDQEGGTNIATTTTVANQTELQLQTLSLRHNAISDLTSFESLFGQLRHLKWLDLSANQLTQIPTNILQNTSLVKLNLAHNNLELNDKTDQCFGVEHSLKYLDITFNELTTLSSRLCSCIHLIELLASNNRIQSFNYVSPLTKTLTQLQRLDLFDNPIESNDQRPMFDFLSNHSHLTSLSLNGLGIKQLDELSVPYLHKLELSHNTITTINSKVLSRSRNIRHLNLAFNKLSEVPKHIWKYVTRLRYLDLRQNPIEILDSSSFAGLKYLKYLDIRGLKLQFIDSRIFLYQSELSTLKISTYPSIRSFRLQDILSKSDALKTVEIDMKESLLSHQIQWAFGGKLRELVITGQNLVHIVPDAFQGLNNANDLTLRISNTSIKHLPEGLLKYLADIRYITIDLRGNQLETVSPSVFFSRYATKDNAKSWQSRQLLGGIILEDNPLWCDCNLLWISNWMKQIYTEMKSINIEAAIHVKSSLALSKCRLSDSKWSSANTNRVNHTWQSQLIPVIQLTDQLIEGCEENSAKSCTSIEWMVLLIIFPFRYVLY